MLKLPIDREPLYAPEMLEKSTPLRVDPKEHTMKEAAFLGYIGRANVNTDGIHTKKFSAEQCRALGEALTNALPIRVMGVWQPDLGIVARLHGYSVTQKGLLHHERENASFNSRRSSFAYVADSQGNQELWILVFPSKQYVDQMAELVRAIACDRNRISPESPDYKIETWHFTGLETSVSHWSGFYEGIRPHVRHGDVVAFGNVVRFERGLVAAGFRPTTDVWARFGLKNTFGAKTLISQSGAARIVLVGVEECFWGESIAHYVDSMIRAGARHILYGSKAASLIGTDTVHDVVAPGSFLQVSSDGIPEFEGCHQQSLDEMLATFRIKQCGLAVTVPTVIGETQRQRKRYNARTPSCMDCEDAHIARVVHEANGKLGPSAVAFVPVHFITDYIYRDQEQPQKGLSNLSSDTTLPEHNEQRNDAFLRIGQFFALYTLQHAQREHITCQLTEGQVSGDIGAADALKNAMQAAHPLLDFGYDREAIALVLGRHSESTPAATVVALSMIGQKYGHPELVLETAAAISRPKKGVRIPKTHALRVAVCHLKMQTQVGAYDSALHLATSLHKDQSKLKEIDQYCAFKRRHALCLAAHRDKDGFERALHESEVHAANNVRRPYHTAVNTLMRLIGLILLGEKDNTDLDAITAELSKVRATLGRQKWTREVWWQSNPDKSWLTALFLEATWLLCYGDQRRKTRGLNCLFLANLLNVRVRGNEQSEGYGDVLSAVRNPGIRERLSLAMRSDSSARAAFRGWLRTESLAELAQNPNALELLRTPPDKRENALRDLLSAPDGTGAKRRSRKA